MEGIGPKTVKTLWEKLKIKNLDELEAAARAGTLRALPGFGEKSEEKILKGIAFRREVGGRMILGAVLPVAHALEHKIGAFPEVKKAVAAGSVRRMKETVGDIDILAVSEKPEETMKKIAKLPEIERINVRIVQPESWGAVLNHFTGSRAHNIALRERALKKGWKLNEHGLFSTEEELYAKLGLKYIEPELREDTGEIEASAGGKLPKLIKLSDIKADLQIHSNFDIETSHDLGENSMEEIIKKGGELGYKYLAFTEHNPSVSGHSDKKTVEILTRKREKIDKINYSLIQNGSNSVKKVFNSLEIDILSDGKLAIPVKALDLIDFALVSIHSNFDFLS